MSHELEEVRDPGSRDGLNQVFFEEPILEVWTSAEGFAVSSVDLGKGINNTYIAVGYPMQRASERLQIIFPRINCNGDLIGFSEPVKRNFLSIQIRCNVCPGKTAVWVKVAIIFSQIFYTPEEEPETCENCTLYTSMMVV